MKRSLLTGIICISALLLTLIAVLSGFGLYRAQYEDVFRDVTVELGTESLSVSDFLIDSADRSGSFFVSNVRTVDLGAVGSTPITLRRGRKIQTVTLTVQDTTAPAVEFKTEFTAPLGSTPQPGDFIISIEDPSETSSAFAVAPAEAAEYSDQKVTVAVTDRYGNTTTGEATLRFDWIYPEVKLELGTALTKAHILVDPDKDGELITDEAINEINLGGAGKYTLTAQSGSSIRSCSITVADTQPPVLELKEVSLLPGWSCTMDDFVVSATDASGEVKLELLSELPFGTQGDHTVKIRATDQNGLTIVGETRLRIHNDITPPVIYGLYNISQTANQPAPDYDTKVYALDSADGNVSYTYDASDVDLTRAGIYYVIYTAADSTGNVATSRRKVVIKPDYANTEQLIKDIAASLDKTDPESLRDFVRDNITYLGPAWGGEDPVTYGFTKWYGNCYVHAMCLKALLDYFGYENDIIHLMPQYNPHYWNLVKIDGVWYHIDSTPSFSHTRYSLMNNQQRLSTLKGRRWDTDKWPQLNDEEE